MEKRIQDLEIVKSFKSGKVREIYDLGDKLLLVTSDRISAFDVVFDDIIPNKGKILNQISVYFLKETKHIIDNHFITDVIDEYPEELHQFRDQLEHRSMLVRKTRVVPFECIARGYITGSAWKEYQKSGTVNTEEISEKLQESQRFPEPLFTPSTKAEEGHDINISFAEMKERMDPNIADKLRDVTLELYKFGHAFLNERNIILADTKLEYGTIDGKIILIDEIFTPDSSRFWDKGEYEIGKTPKSYDKQFVRDYLKDTGWDKNPPAPRIPQEIIDKTYQKYYEAYKIIAGEKALTW